jgi:hypothetical protein
LVDSLRNSDLRTTLFILAVYLFWFKTGLFLYFGPKKTLLNKIRLLYFILKGTDQTTISAIFSMKTQGDVSHYLSQARTALMKNFVHNNLGASTQNRESWLHTIPV